MLLVALICKASSVVNAVDISVVFVKGALCVSVLIICMHVFNLVNFSQLFMLHGFNHCLCYSLLVLTKFSYTVLQYNPSALKHSCQHYI